MKMFGQVDVNVNVKASRNFASHLKEFRTWSVKPLEDHNYKFWKKYKEKLLEDSRDRVSRYIQNAFSTRKKVSTQDDYSLIEFWFE